MTKNSYSRSIFPEDCCIGGLVDAVLSLEDICRHVFEDAIGAALSASRIRIADGFGLMGVKLVISVFTSEVQILEMLLPPALCNCRCEPITWESDDDRERRWRGTRGTMAKT